MPAYSMGITAGDRAASGYAAAPLRLLVCCVALAAGASGAVEWSECEHSWNSLRIVVRTDIGLYSAKVQQAGQNPKVRIGPFSRVELAKFIQTYFMMTTSTQIDETFHLQLDKFITKWGPGHALPILAAAAIENVERGMPGLFGRRIKATAFGSSTQRFKEVEGVSFDPSQSGVLRITVYGDEGSFRQAAVSVTHASPRAYYSSERNEVGLFLDMNAFRGLYGVLERSAAESILLVPSFISFVSTAFNDDCGHEIAHARQRQSKDPAYTLPVIAEGEAEVQGWVRSRNGLYYTLMYNQPEWWVRGAIDFERIKFRLKTMEQIGRPPLAPFEVKRFLELRSLVQRSGNLPVGRLLSMSATAFYAGDTWDVYTRTLQAWALSLAAARSQTIAELLRSAVAARLAGQPAFAQEFELELKIADFIEQPNAVGVTKEKIIDDSEKIFKVDPTLVGLFYVWIYYLDPQDPWALVFLGDALLSAHDMAGAYRYYREARSQRPLSALPLLRLGDVAARTGDRRGAIEMWSQALKTNSAEKGEDLYRQEAHDRMMQVRAIQ